MSAQVQEGDWLDVMDGDGIWNVAQVLRLPTSETMEVTYDCWGDKYNEELRRDSERIAPFHTHTWAVKCWAKLDTWPWWPALLTVRAPGSALGSQNLRLEERLLVDFLDNVEFTERCRCWVKKSKVVAFQSDEETRRRLTKKKKTKAATRAKNLVLSTSLLARCAAREDFPEFVEGTLPVQFEKNFTRPTDEVRKEMGEEIWTRGFAHNRINHAATHAYTPVTAVESNVDSGNGTETSKSVEKDKSAGCDDSETQVGGRSSSDTGKNDTSKDLKNNNDTVAETKKTTTQKPKNPRKRARPDTEDETSDSTDTSRTGMAKSTRAQTQKNDPDQLQIVNSVADKSSEVSKVSPRKYGKTPKVLKTPRRAATNLPPYTPPYARVLLGATSWSEKHVTQTSHARRTRHTTHTQPRTKKGVIDKEFPTTTHQQMQPAAQQTMVTEQRSAPSDSKSDDGSASPMKVLAQLTKTTVQGDEKLLQMETALEGKLTELAEKSTKAEELRSKCAALRNRMHSPITTPASKVQEVGQSDSQSPRVRSPTSLNANSPQKAAPHSPRRGNKPHNRPDASRVPNLARRSLQAKCGIRGLELVMDDIISKELNQNLSSATTAAELDAIKADLLNSPEVQAAITRIQHPSYGRTAPTTSGYSNLRVWEDTKPRFTIDAWSFERKPSPRSPSQHFGRSRGYELENEARAERLQSPSSLLLNSQSADRTSFGFSVDDNFSMTQWHRDLYPKAFNFQR